eukprot:TRINITY_DN19036_c0_g1_i2.p1 TRINITY_DN19036_c0_g1~~TRINITY_DN19036_c0_g1_i2.p1  ORF type:complete len:422 (-),score=60.55 TRINITY_DN19036_c0_g1_i2:111-1301(-)
MAAIQLKSCRGRWTWRLLLGPCVVLAGIIGVMLGEFNFLELQRNIVQDVSDMMFIDDTTQTYHKGPLGKSTSELEQFQEWKKPMREALKECMQEHGDNQNECMDGFDFEVAVFNVTNTEDVVLQGSIPQVQELGPIFAKKYIDKFDIDTLHWDKTGVARFRQNASIELDRQRCGQACKKLLKQEIVIPNPAWAKIISEGLELPFGIVLAARHVIAEIAPTELRSQVMKMFGLANDMETTAVLATFFFPFSSSNSGFSSNSNNNINSNMGSSSNNNSSYRRFSSSSSSSERRGRSAVGTSNGHSFGNVNGIAPRGSIRSAVSRGGRSLSPPTRPKGLGMGDWRSSPSSLPRLSSATSLAAGTTRLPPWEVPALDSSFTTEPVAKPKRLNYSSIGLIP